MKVYQVEIEAKEATEIAHQAECQHCDTPVEYGPTEHGYRGFVHLITGTTVCPEPVR